MKFGGKGIWNADSCKGEKLTEEAYMCGGCQHIVSKYKLAFLKFNTKKKRDLY
jgi:hypothetical protein